MNKRKTIPEVLGEAGEPITTTDCASKFAAKLGIACEEREIAQIAHRISAVLTQLTSAGRVRQSGPFEGRKHLWAVAA